MGATASRPLTAVKLLPWLLGFVFGQILWVHMKSDAGWADLSVWSEGLRRGAVHFMVGCSFWYLYSLFRELISHRRSSSSGARGVEN